jgi:hypothetical protein
MLNYNQIKEKESQNTKNFSDKKLLMYINAHRVILFFYSYFFCWIFSMSAFLLVPFFLLNNPVGYLVSIIFHLVSWKFYLKGYIDENTADDKNDVVLTIGVLKDIQSDRKKSK